MDSESEKEYIEILPIIKEPAVSIDRITLLVYSPRLSVYEYYEEDEYNNNRKDAIDMLVQSINEAYPEESYHNFKGRGDTRLYMHHIRVNGIDIQLCTKFGVRQKVDDKGYVEVFGDDEEKSQGYIYEWYSSDYNIRIEYNPNKVSIKEIEKILSIIRRLFCGQYEEASFIKVSRIDIAFDYPKPVNPCLINLRRSRKFMLVGGSDGAESSYLGTRRSVNTLNPYNKKKELLQKYNILYPGDHLWRIELRHTGNWYIHDLPRFEDVLNNIDIHHFGIMELDDFGENDWIMNLIYMSSVNFHMKTILGMMPSKTKYRYMKRLRESHGSQIAHPVMLYVNYFKPVWDKLYADIIGSFGFNLQTFPFRDSPSPVGE